jgi:hypothetical protein
MPKVTDLNAKQIAKKLHINLEVVTLPVFKYALHVELEHGRKFGRMTNLTHDDLLLTGRIVLAHLLESPDYYHRLKRMETIADKYWKTHKKPNVLSKK